MISKELMARAAAGLVLMAVLCSLPSFAQAESSGDADTGRLERLEAEVAALRADLAARPEPSSGELAEPAELERRIDALAAEIEKLRLGEATSEADRSEHGLGPAASKVYRVGQGLSVGGYGELLYQNFADRRDDGSPAGRTDEFDLLRGVFRRHGALAADVLGDARSSADLGEDFGAGLSEREVRYFIEREWAATAEDVLWRRSKAGLHLDARERERVAAYVGR